MFGYDTELAPGGMDDSEILEVLGNRILLSRDRALLKRAGRGLYIPYTDSAKQVKLLVNELGLKISEPVAERCTLCNGTLTGEPAENLPKHVTKGWRCTECGQQYWEGGHWEGMKRFIGEVARAGL